MRKSIFLTALLLTTPALAADKSAAITGATATLDKSDDAVNAGDAKLLVSLFDKNYFYAGATPTVHFPDVESTKAAVEKEFAEGPVGHFTRNELTIRANDAGDTVWYVADYTFVPKVKPGMLPVHRKMREAGVLVKRGAAWKFAMVHSSQLAPDPKPTTPPTPPPAAK